MDSLPLIIAALALIIIFFIISRAFSRLKKELRIVYMISAVKPGSDDIEMHVSVHKTEIDELEKDYKNRGYKTARKEQELQMSVPKERSSLM